LLQRVPDAAGPSCIRLDIRIPGLSGPDLQDRLAALGSHLPIVFLTGHADVPTTVKVMKAGADDLLTKPVTKDELIAALERAIARSRAWREKNEQFHSLQKLVDSLTPRERQVFERVARGRMNKEIGRELGATERTIKAHRSNIMDKLQITSAAELVLIAERLGVLVEQPAEIRR
jgi:FixJ family two-component response regulator